MNFGIFLLLLSAFQSDERPVTEATSGSASIAQAIVQPIAVTVELQFQMAIIDKQVEIIRLQACSEAGIKHTECAFDWQKRTVTRQSKAAKPQVP